MPKKVVIITLSTNTAKFYSEQLLELFQDNVLITSFSYEKDPIKENIDADLVVLSTHSIYETAKKYLSPKSEIVIIKATFSRNGLNQIANIPSGTKAMLVNISLEMAIEVISLIYHLGKNHIELFPVYPGMLNTPDCDLAITPGELDLVPKNVKAIIDIGNRLLDLDTVLEIAMKLKLQHLIYSKKFKDYMGSIVTNNYSFEKLAYKTNSLESQFDILLKVLDEGIIGVNALGLIFAFNDSAESIIGISKADMLGKKASLVLPDIPFENIHRTLHPIDQKLIKLNGVHVSLNLVPVLSANHLLGSFAIIRKFKEAEYQQSKLRAQLMNKGHRAKYFFDDIVGNSPVILKTKEVAQKMAKSDSPILISGESGAGKELFAQAIHNSSKQKNFPFVAINCAAIPENLLESELFGYEEGAFSGAKKGGKYGLLEFAHLGTLFLDEIGEMSLSLQVKLLRVIQEKEVMRIGGNQVINVAVRIIAATNKNLHELVQEGAFRKDLYYRLSVLNLNIPPLRKRGNDIIILTDRFMQEIGSHFELSKLAQQAFMQYGWEGNIRELRNCIEYLTCMGSNFIDIEDLPFAHRLSYNEKLLYQNNEVFPDKLKELAGPRLDDYIFVLKFLAISYQERKTVGRRSIADEATTKGYFLTEQQIRNILVDLAECSLVFITRGRSGSKITKLGLTLINRVNGLNGDQ